MNIQEAKEEIIRTVRAYTAKDDNGCRRIPPARQRPVLLMGPPGIGKTAIMEQAAEECGVGLAAYTITHHTRQSAVGLPQLVNRKFGDREYTMTEYTMSEIVGAVYEYQERTGYREGLLFVDEINCVSETLAPTMLQFLQYKTFGNHRIPDGWVIVAAGNPREYNTSVRELDMAALDRVRLLEVEANLSVWKEYALRQDVHPLVLSYLELHPEHFYQVTLTRDKREFVTARGWEDLSVLLREYERQGLPVSREFMKEFLRVPKIASDFASWYQLCRTYLGQYRFQEFVEGRLTGQEMEELKSCLRAAKGDVRSMFVYYLLSAASEKLTACGRGSRYQEREKEVLSQLASYIKGEGKGDPDGFLQRRLHARQVQKENGLLKPWEESMECAVDERLRELLLSPGRLQVVSELQNCRKVEEDSCPSLGLGEKRERLAREKEELTAFLDRMTDFLLEAFGEDLELADWLQGLQNHGDIRRVGYERRDLHRLLEQKDQEERLRRTIAEMEELYEAADRK